MVNINPPGSGVSGPTMYVGGTAVANGTNGYILYNNNGTLGQIAATSIGVDLDVGTTVINSGATGRILYDNAGVLGEYPIGTGVSAALAINVGSAGAFVVFNGALGTPSSGTLTNTTGFPTANLAGAGAGVLTFLATPSSANLRSALTDETGAGAAVFADGPTFATKIILPSAAFASLPAAGTAGSVVRSSNAGATGSLWMDDGARWKAANNTAMLASLNSASSGINASETIVFQYQMPAGYWQVGDILRLYITMTKSGTTNSGVMVVHIGTAGTTGDTTVQSGTVLSTTQRTGAFFFDFRLESATSVQVLSNANTGYGFASTSALASAVAISNVSNSLFFSVGINGGASDTATLLGAQLWTISKATA